MKKFIVLYYASADAIARTKDFSPEDMKKGMDAWMAWAKECGDALVDFGTPLVEGVKVNPSGAHPSKSGVMGYSVLQANDMDEAVGMVKDHPHLAWAGGCDIEVHESKPMPK